MSKTAEHRGLPEQERSLIEAQYEASGTIYGSNDFAEILETLLSIAGSVFAFGHLGLVEPDGATVRIVATADQDGVHSAEQYRPLSDYPAYETLTAVEVLISEDVPEDTFLSDAERARLTEQNIRSLLITPLVVGQRLIGLLMLWNAAPVSVSNDRLRTLRNLADQAAVVFENQELLRSTEATLEEVRTLYDINRAMLGAQHMLDIMHLLRSYLALDAQTILHILYQDRPDIGWHPVLHYHLTAGEEGIINTPLQIAGELEALESANVLFVENAAGNAPNPFNTYLREQGAASYVLLYMAQDSQVRDVIAILFEARQIFDLRTRRLYEAIADQIRIVLENQRLLRDTQAGTIQLSRQVRVLQAVNRLASGVGSFNNDEQALLDYTIHEMTTSLDADHGGLMMFDPELIYGTVRAEYPSHGTSGVSLEMRGNALFEAMRENPSHPFIVYDVEHDHRVTPDTLQVFKSAGIKSLMMVPIMLEGRLIASIGLDLYTRERQFTPEMIELAQTMGAQFAIGLQNVRLLTEAQRRADQLQRIAFFSQSMQATFDLSTLLSVMLNETRQMLSLDRITIALHDSLQDELRAVAQYENHRTKILVENGTLISPTDPLIGEVWRTEKLLSIGDTQEESEERRVHAAAMRSVLILPLRMRGQLRGAVEVSSRTPYSYSETDAALLQQLIAQFAVALENSEAYAQSQRAARNQALVNDIAAQYQEVSTVDELLRVTLEGLSKSLGAKRGGIRLGNVQEVNS